MLCVQWYGFGTYAASLIGGLTLGAAKNATIYSGAQRLYRAGCPVSAYWEEPLCGGAAIL